jgi:phosphatidylserine/phosphatidylglycerophosphate/cardiolipin synthase-like enzyme
MSGPIAAQFTEFWKNYWANALEQNRTVDQIAFNHTSSHPPTPQLANIMCKFLPSPHHRNPNFRLPWQNCAPAPKTPLNTEILTLFEHAQRSIFIQTPNLTCPPVLNAILGALDRGVNVRITTSERLMILEQLVTAGTTTSRCVKGLIKKYKRLQSRPRDEEVGRRPPGALRISYYEPRKSREEGVIEPVQSHLKLTVVDEVTAVFGSGNMDRASWFTSQELGVAFTSPEMVEMSMRMLQDNMAGREKLVYDSEAPR